MNITYPPTSLLFLQLVHWCNGPGSSGGIYAYLVLLLKVHYNRFCACNDAYIFAICALFSCIISLSLHLHLFLFISSCLPLFPRTSLYLSLFARFPPFFSIFLHFLLFLSIPLHFTSFPFIYLCHFLSFPSMFIIGRCLFLSVSLYHFQKQSPPRSRKSAGTCPSIYPLFYYMFGALCVTLGGRCTTLPASFYAKSKA